MRSARSILSVRYSAVNVTGGVRRAVGGFLRYIQQRDHHHDLEKAGGIEGFLRYAAHRDRTNRQGRLFGRDGDAGDRDRRELGRFVTRSVQGRERGRAYYRFVLSPEDSRGLDLRQITRQVMAQIERDAGEGGPPPWIAAEHRNTVHPHVHVVMAAHRQLPNGRYRALIINKERLSRMKISMSREIYRQRGWERDLDDRRLLRSTRERAGLTVVRGQDEPHRQSHRNLSLTLTLATSLRAVARRLSARYRHELEQELERIRQGQERSRGRYPGLDLER